MNLHAAFHIHQSGCRWIFTPVRKLNFDEYELLFLITNNPGNGTNSFIKTIVYPAMISIFNMEGKKIKDLPVAGDFTRLTVLESAHGVYSVVLQKNGEIIAAGQLIIK